MPNGNDVRGLADFHSVVCCDFEYRADPGEKHWPICMVSYELHSGREVRMWRDELLNHGCAPFDTGPDALFVSYSATAELACFHALGWPMPAHVVDPFVEHRCETNGLTLPCGNGLLGALALRGLAHIDAGGKKAMIELIISRTTWSADEQAAILDYCATDVHGVAALLAKMAPTLDWPRALLRGRYQVAVARMEWTGVPIDTALYRALVEKWAGMRQTLIDEVDADYGVYDKGSFKTVRFVACLARLGIPSWPTLPSGAPDLKEKTFRDWALAHPELGPLHALRCTLAGLRLTRLAVGSDGRNRFQIHPFSTVTGRNAPSTTECIFGPATWMRGLIRPPEGCAILYLDWSAQEYALAGVLSGDARMIADYLSDPYLSFAKAARLAPSDATKESHPRVRELCKTVVLGLGYGMEAPSMAARTGLPLCEALELLRVHRQTYTTFWRWSDDVVAHARLSGEMRTVFGWRRRDGRGAETRSLLNWPMQSHGSEMLRLACIAMTEAGIEVAAPVHDAVLIVAPLPQLEELAAQARELMIQASRAVTGGVALRVDTRLVTWPERYQDPRGLEMWTRVMRILADQGGGGWGAFRTYKKEEEDREIGIGDIPLYPPTPSLVQP